MKHSIKVLTILAMATLSGCLVSSLHPFFKQKDKFYDPDIVGYWIDGDSCIWTIAPDKYINMISGRETQDGTYNITYYEDSESISELQGTLFQLNDINYVDFIPDPDGDNMNSDMASWHHIPVHTLARVRYNRDSILLYWFFDEMLSDLFKQNRIRIKHETVESLDYDRHVLTASTDELQKFIKKYLNASDATSDIERVFTTGADEEGEFGFFLKLKPYHGPLPGKPARQVSP